MQNTALSDSPDLRRAVLTERLAAGTRLSAAALAAEFDVSRDTIRRDLSALEAEGLLRRVRGGACPVAPPAAPLSKRAAVTLPPEAIARRAAAHLAGARTLLIDGGVTAIAVARALVPGPDLVVITPSPRVAAATAEAGIETIALGGRISTRGGIAVGPETEAALAGHAADWAVLGACGLDAGFGLSSDDFSESAIKAAMARAAARTLIVAAAEKIGRRARHRTLPPSGIDGLVTDAPTRRTADLAAADITILTP